MLKKILFSLLTLLLVYSAGIIGYKSYEPDKTSLYVSALVNDVNNLDFDTLEEYTLNSGSSAIHYYLFVAPDNDDSAYLENTIMKQLKRDPNATGINLFEYVQIDDVEKNAINMQKKWGVSSVPALLCVKVEDGKIVVVNVLENNNKQPLTIEDVKQWMIQNGLYQCSNSAEPIAQPTK